MLTASRYRPADCRAEAVAAAAGGGVRVAGGQPVDGYAVAASLKHRLTSPAGWCVCVCGEKKTIFFFVRAVASAYVVEDYCSLTSERQDAIFC